MAFSRGAWVDLGGTGAPPVVRAEVIAALLLGAGGAEPGSAAGIRLRGAEITGRLDLMGGTVAWPLVCRDCQFDTELGFVDGSVRTVRILDLTGSKVAGGVRLEQAKVSGSRAPLT